MRRRELARQVMEWFEVSCQRACGLLLLQRSSFYYRSKRKEHVALKMRLKELALVRIRFGYPRLTVLFKREGWAVGRKHRFWSMAEACARLETWREDYNTERPHSALANLPPAAFAASISSQQTGRRYP